MLEDSGSDEVLTRSFAPGNEHAWPEDAQRFEGLHQTFLVEASVAQRLELCLREHIDLLDFWENLGERCNGFVEVFPEEWL